MDFISYLGTFIFAFMIGFYTGGVRKNRDIKKKMEIFIDLAKYGKSPHNEEIIEALNTFKYIYFCKD